MSTLSILSGHTQRKPCIWFADLPGSASALQPVEVPGAYPQGQPRDQDSGQPDPDILLRDWGREVDCIGNLDFDGDTDQGDLAVLLAHWGEGWPQLAASWAMLSNCGAKAHEPQGAPAH